MSGSEHKIINKNNKLIVCFGGMASKFGGIVPFEFLSYLTSNYETCDLVFFIDKDQCWYHNGLKDITNNIGDTVTYINNIIRGYDKIVFMGISAGGYASILFGSLCVKVDCVISFIPQTIIKNPINKKYSNLKNIINNKTKYIIYGNKSVDDINDLHHISHCRNLQGFSNVKIIEGDNCNMKHLRDSGFIKKLLDDALSFRSLHH